jgi:translocation and assembly module TamB
MAARDLNAEVNYLSGDGPLWDCDRPERSADEDGGAAGGAVEAASWTAELGRDMAQLKSLEFDSGKASVLHATGTLNHFAQPEWQAAVNGTLELKQLIGAGGRGGADRRARWRLR